MKKWEYKIITVYSLDKISVINIELKNLGEQGWEMCGISSAEYHYSKIYFKREKSN